MNSQSQQEIDITRKLFLLANGIALGVPAFSLAIIYSYSLFFDIVFEKSDWRTVFFIVWLGTMLVLLREAYSKYREYNRLYSTKNRKAGQRRYRQGSRVSAWEQRKTSRLSKDLVNAAIIIPSISISLVYLYSCASGYFLKRSDWKMVVFCVWLGVLIALARESLKAGKEKVSY
jgi:hypothetical protein